MEKFWALDFVGERECELVYNDQLYKSWDEANTARVETGRPELFDITEYRLVDLEDVYDSKVQITNDLHVLMV